MTARMHSARTDAARASPYAVFAFAAAGIGLIDGLLTRPDAWSAALVRPDWHPPVWIFGPAWLIVLCLSSVAAAVAWTELSSDDDRRILLRLLAINAALNIAWSPLFFMLHRPDFALADIAMLWLSILGCIAFLKSLAPKAALLFSPYLAWVTIATALNFEIVRLNAPF